jgi:DNA repair exonuclease SbcCD nuclease subunit
MSDPRSAYRHDETVRLLHIADVHLDRPLVGLAPNVARQRRGDLADTFGRCLIAAREHGADAVTIGGDLWEDENVTPDTRQSVAHQLGQLEIPVLMITGNHDPYLRGGAYQRTEWPDNVEIFDSNEPAEKRLDSGVSVWGASWTERPLTADFLQTLRVPPEDGRTHLLLIHGTARDERFSATDTHCPFDPGDARRAGFRLVLCGHIHAGSCANDVVYPGSPEPLDHSEVGRHCYALVETEGGQVEVELVDVNRRRYVSLAVDCSDASSSAEVEERVRDALPAEGGNADAIVNVRLHGETAPECAIDQSLLISRLEGDFAAVGVKDETTPAVEYSEIARRHSADGLFVAGMLGRIEQAEDERERRVLEMALQAGVRAMAGRKDVLSVG